MTALQSVTPDIEIFSIDEAFLDVTHCQSLHGNPIQIGQLTKQIVWEASHLLCSVGVSGDKTTAKYAAKREKPNGFTIIPPWEAKAVLKNIPVTELCGIAHGIGNFLKKYGVITCGDMEKIPISILAKRFGNLGRRIWHMCQGSDPEPVKISAADAKSMGHGKVLPPNTHDEHTIQIYFQHMSEKLAARLRRCKLDYPTDDGKTIFHLAQRILKSYWHPNTEVLQVQITALDPPPQMIQPDLFGAPDKRRQKVNKAVDVINARYGELKIAPARLIERSEMPNVIGPCQRTE